MFFKPKEKKVYADLPASIRNSNAKKFYQQTGSDEFVKKLPKNKRAKMRRYNMEVARAFDRDTYEGNDVNRGLQDINKKYGFQTFSESCYFLNDIAEFAKKKETNKGDIYNKSMKGWTKNGALAGASIGGVAGSGLGPVGTALGAAQGGLYGGLAGATLGAYRNAFRNIKKVAKDPKEERKLRRARRGVAIGTLTPLPVAGSLIGAYS